jgi:oligopeptide/dipeptide ABC transporter ATP-binding protein
VKVLLDVTDLSVELVTKSGLVTIIDGINFQVHEGEIFGIAGESGSGKTMAVLALLGLLPRGARVGGEANFSGVNLVELEGRRLREIRGRDIAMVFQDPMTSLHPMLTIEQQMTDHLRFHQHVGRSVARKRAVELLHEVRIPDAEGALKAFPHHFSGGMRQRIAIAVALACGPKVLIADEPTTALDVTVQAGILRLLDDLRTRTGLAVIMITHDLGVMSLIADSLSVFYAGRVIESGPTYEVLTHPRHPYTKGLLDALPNPAAAQDAPLVPLGGSPPSPSARPTGCAFHPRCAFAASGCRTSIPPLEQIGDRQLACPIDPFREAN